MFNILKTLVSDLKIFWTIVKISLNPEKINPLYLAHVAKENRKKEQLSKKNYLKEKLKKEYRDSLVKDGFESEEIEEQMLASEDYLEKKASVITFAFNVSKEDVKTNAELEVERAMNAIYNSRFILRIYMYCVIIGCGLFGILILLKNMLTN